MCSHGMTQLCQQGRMQLWGDVWELQPLMPSHFVQAVHGIQGKVIGVRAGHFPASSQAANQSTQSSRSCTRQVTWCQIRTIEETMLVALHDTKTSAPGAMLI